ncbi:MAG: transketolase [bacterium]|nr:transketolase [bacterium]
MNSNLPSVLRMLCADTVQKAKSGHPGMPIGTADIASVLWSEFLSFNPADPKWINRDRFVLSAGHGSSLLYSLLHLFGYDVSIEDLKSFRQWGSRTAGHPEYGHIDGIECTTGPLGQGIAMAAGMALASKMAAERFNTESFKVIDHNIYAIAGDGCLMEGVSAEASSIAGHLGLDNLILLYDSNRITIEGSTDLAFSEDVGKRYESYGWKVYTADGHSIDEIRNVLKEAEAYKGAPKLVIFKTHIACGSPNKQDKSSSHGSPLGDDEIKAMKKIFGLPEDKTFYVPEDVRKFCAGTVEEKKKAYDAWQKGFSSWKESNPEKAELLSKCLSKEIPENFAEKLIEGITGKAEATRVSSGNIIQKAAEAVPFMTGGSADLEPSVKCHIKAETSVQRDSFAGRNLHFGIREHGMGGVMNGMALYGLFVPYGATFLVFSDYMRGAVRLSALMGVQTVYVFTHDSIFLGEDGPTHQPVEHTSSLRAIPNLTVIRPADALETAGAWYYALNRKNGPTALILSRQNLPLLHGNPSKEDLYETLKGGYVIAREESKAEAIIVASGSEVSLACDAKKMLKEEGIDVRVVSVPSLEVFEEQDKEYIESVIPSGVPVVAIEAAVTRDWDRYTAKGGFSIAMNSFGSSAPAGILAEKFGFTAEQAAKKIREYLR